MVSILLCCSVLFSVPASDWKQLKGPYFGKRPPSDKALILLDGVLCKPNTAEMCSVFSPNGRQFYFCKQTEGGWAIYYTKLSAEGWTPPRPVSFSDRRYNDRDFTMSPDGETILFGSNRPMADGEKLSDRLHLFFSRKTKTGWGAPKAFKDPVNRYGGNYPSVAANGNLYFFRCKETAVGKCDLMLSRFSGGKYQRAVSLDSRINSSHHDWDCFVAPDESYIIFSSLGRADTIGDQDLYIAFKKRGKWQRAKNMGPRVNSFSSEICPVVSSCGNFFLFTSRRRGRADIYWISADIINDLK